MPLLDSLYIFKFNYHKRIKLNCYISVILCSNITLNTAVFCCVELFTELLYRAVRYLCGISIVRTETSGVIRLSTAHYIDAKTLGGNDIGALNVPKASKNKQLIHKATVIITMLSDNLPSIYSYGLVFFLMVIVTNLNLSSLTSIDNSGVFFIGTAIV